MPNAAIAAELGAYRTTMMRQTDAVARQCVGRLRDLLSNELTADHHCPALAGLRRPLRLHQHKVSDVSPNHPQRSLCRAN
jgi:hypothetical protein